ncbi:hypothetical protein MFMK1_002434 [Metallumcola ferriviriculae]|uniref:Uncharacterized protein n=1 Tax=Metallumcola ferriviriculae TaxID=3039180 RepID=A0AAU0UQX2_9FIRM|nr:hypothetical protein MFMK1_002434 [Desulfitibacteraceae bacterium MK1]
MQLTQVIAVYLAEKEGEQRAEFPDIERGMKVFQDYLNDWTAVPVAKVTQISAMHFQEFFGWWYIRKCRPTPAMARHLLMVMEDFCNFVLRRYDVNLLPIYRPVLDELKEALPRVLTLQSAISPIKSQEYLRYAVASYGEEGAKRMGAIGDYEDIIADYMKVVDLGEGTDICLRTLTDNYDIGPITIPLEAARLVREGDVIYLEVGEKEGAWEIIDSGFAYPWVPVDLS